MSLKAMQYEHAEKADEPREELVGSTPLSAFRIPQIKELSKKCSVALIHKSSEQHASAQIRVPVSDSSKLIYNNK